MNVEIGTEAAQFPEKEYINGFFLAVQGKWESDGGITVWDRSYSICTSDFLKDWLVSVGSLRTHVYHTLPCIDPEAKFIVHSWGI
jgi:hypothetical protein